MLELAEQPTIIVPTEQPFVRIFQDKDGCLSDFLKGFWNLFKKDFDALPIGVAWKLINSVPKFYATLPHMADVDIYWKEARKYRPTILTGCPPANFEIHKAAKLEWHADNHYLSDGSVFLRDTEEIVCLTKDKPLHMVNPGDILVDDTLKNCQKWKDAGGRAIHFKHARQAAAELRDLVTELKAQGHRFNDD
jgi:hypothetical protein